MNPDLSPAEPAKAGTPNAGTPTGFWLLPTRRRIPRLTRFLEAAIRTGISTPGRILVQRRELESLAGDYARLPLPENWRVVPTETDGFGDKQREYWPEIREAAWTGVMGDDMVPETPRWDALLLERLRPGLVVSCYDPKGRISAPIYSGELLRAVGCLFPPGFWHQYTDDLWETLGRQTGCWQIYPELMVRHIHPFRKDGDPVDETHRLSYGRTHQDKAAWERWKQTEMKPALERIRAMQAALAVPGS